MARSSLAALLREVRACRLCEAHLPLGPRPVLQASASARVLIAGQAPGVRVHGTGVPFDDPSGARLRAWLGLDERTFWDARQVAILPMGFCYPGTGASGDLPPRPECAVAWRAALLDRMPKVALTLVLGQHALRWHLPSERGTLTDAVRAWRERGGDVLPLPHPSPRNNRWLARNVWFEREVLPPLRERVRALLTR